MSSAGTTPGTSGALSRFHPAVRAWFQTRFVHGATEPQVAGWEAIASGGDTLIAAPTGSGKTLAAFLCAIDEMYREAERGALTGGVRVLYISPLKALATDIQENLLRPLAEIAETASSLGLASPELRVGARTGDTPAGERARQLKAPPHLLVTTPESLYLLVTAAHGRELLGTVRTVICDEIHALAGDKRGAHLALSLERLAALPAARPQRIGLSATQKPIETVAELLVGFPERRHGDTDAAPARNACAIVDAGHRRTLDVGIELFDRELSAVASTEAMLEVAERIARHAQSCRTTLVFANTRRLAERFAHLLAEHLGPDRVAAHHGSLSKDRRRRVEGALRAGELSVLVATASLELGIDIGAVDLVCQLGSPRSIATFLQRVGRSGHNRFAVPRGVLFPFTRDELVECTALLREVRRGRLDALIVPRAPLDILAQQLVAECAARTWDEDSLFALVRRAAPFVELNRAEFDRVLALMVTGIDTGRGRRAAFLHRDGIHRTVRGRKGARLAALTSGGAIPETADYRVIEEPGDTFIGTLNEDFAIESMAGDVFLLGSTAWRIKRVSSGTVRVVNAGGAPPSIPFWLGEAPSRTRELSAAVAELRHAVGRALELGETGALDELLIGECGLGGRAAAVLVDYLREAKQALGVLPTQGELVVERFFDETGGMQLVVHSPFGARINRGLGLLMRKRFCRSFDFELQAAANDDAIVLSLGPQHSFPLEEVAEFLQPAGVRHALVHALLVTPIFLARWRWNLNRWLVVLRRRGGKRVPPQIQRMEADDVMAAVFPSLAACQDNATGPREIPDHPIVNQALHDCLTEAMDLPGLERLLHQVADGAVQLHLRDTTEPSPLAHEILNGRPYTFLDDAPLEERRTRAVHLSRGLPLESRDLSLLDPEAVRRVREEVAPQVEGVEGLHELLYDRIALPPQAEWQSWFDSLSESGRAAALRTSDRTLWVAAERLEAVRAFFCTQARAGRQTATRPSLPSEAEQFAQETDDALLLPLLRGALEASGPITSGRLAELVGLTRNEVEYGLSCLELSGFVLRGAFDAALPAPHYCARRLLSRIHAYTQARLRREIEPVSPLDFMRFLLDFQGVTPGQRRLGVSGLLSTIEQLQGFEAAAGEWEKALLPARVAGYAPEMLDDLCFSGDVVWARLTVSDAARDAGWAAFSRTTPIALMLRSDTQWLLAAARGDAVSAESPRPWVRSIVAVLERAGACFAGELAKEANASPEDVREALRDAVARGLVTADGFSGLRGLLSTDASRLHAVGAMRLRTGVRRGGREGRWVRIQTEELPPTDDLAEAVAEQLLCRYGVVFRDMLTRENLRVPWRDILWALRRLEARGVARGGRFVAGFVGEQYALPNAVAQLRQIRKAAKTGQVVRLSASDPLNLVGIVVPGPRLSSSASKGVCFRDGEWFDDAASSVPAAQ